MSALTEIRIGDLKINQGGWACPWAMKFISDGFYQLDSECSLSPTSGGTVQLHVTKKPQGYEVIMHPYFSQVYRWSKSPEDTEDIRVAKFSYAKIPSPDQVDQEAYLSPARPDGIYPYIEGLDIVYETERFKATPGEIIFYNRWLAASNKKSSSDKPLLVEPDQK